MFYPSSPVPSVSDFRNDANAHHRDILLLNSDDIFLLLQVAVSICCCRRAHHPEYVSSDGDVPNL